MRNWSEARVPTLIPAQITRAGRIVDCVVRDISARGARLRVPDAGAVLQRLEVFLKARIPARACPLAAER